MILSCSSGWESLLHRSIFSSAEYNAAETGSKQTKKHSLLTGQLGTQEVNGQITYQWHQLLNTGSAGKWRPKRKPWKAGLGWYPWLQVCDRKVSFNSYNILAVWILQWPGLYFYLQACKDRPSSPETRSKIENKKSYPLEVVYEDSLRVT